MRKFVGLAIATVAAFWMVAPAVAAPSASIQVSPTSQQAGGSVRVSGTCEANTSGFALSHAFLHDATHDFAGVGAAPFTTNATGAFAVTASIPASIPAGTYTVSARCGGGNIGVTATLVVTAASTPPTQATTPPTQVPAGNGGLAATSQTPSTSELALGAAGMALVLLGGVGLARQRARR
ncbi:MAG TPA: hypothetical protein VGN48_14785 [Pedococcus sp.]|nr:hypothetical protein [Pedococcus sp.]